MPAAWTKAHDCPSCGDALELGEDASDGLVVCDCGAGCWVEIDGDSDGESTWNLYRVTLHERCSHHPAAWRSCDNCQSAKAGV